MLEFLMFIIDVCLIVLLGRHVVNMVKSKWNYDEHKVLTGVVFLVVISLCLTTSIQYISQIIN